MPREVKGRPYDATRRRAAAEQTRMRVLAAARELFLTEGYDATPVTQVARRAGVSVDTVYATVGRKPQLLLAVHDMELAGAPSPVGREERDYVREMRAAAGARTKLELYAAALADRLPRTVPLMDALRSAGATDPECAAAHEALSERRAQGMRGLAAELLATGELRAGLAVDDVATLLWSMNSPDYFLLLQRRGLAPQEYAVLVTRVWTHTLLPDEPAEPATTGRRARRRST